MSDFANRVRADMATWSLVNSDPGLTMLKHALEIIDQRGPNHVSRAAETSACLEIKRAVLLIEKATYDRLDHKTEAVTG